MRKCTGEIKYVRIASNVLHNRLPLRHVSFFKSARPSRSLHAASDSLYYFPVYSAPNMVIARFNNHINETCSRLLYISLWDHHVRIRACVCVYVCVLRLESVVGIHRGIGHCDIGGHSSFVFSNRVSPKIPAWKSCELLRWTRLKA
jgi:hypothetical protein